MTEEGTDGTPDVTDGTEETPQPTFEELLKSNAELKAAFDARMKSEGDRRAEDAAATAYKNAKEKAEAEAEKAKKPADEGDKSDANKVLDELKELRKEFAEIKGDTVASKRDAAVKAVGIPEKYLTGCATAEAVYEFAKECPELKAGANAGADFNAEKAKKDPDKLTPAELAMAEKMGVSPEDYKKQKQEIAKLRTDPAG